jgi:hypothetical protein
LDPCISIAPACGGLKPESAIATQALLTKLDRIMDFLLAQLKSPPNYRTNPRRREERPCKQLSPRVACGVGGGRPMRGLSRGYAEV